MNNNTFLDFLFLIKGKYTDFTAYWKCNIILEWMGFYLNIKSHSNAYANTEKLISASVFILNFNISRRQTYSMSCMES